jgi:LacI family transcriptional regulator
MAYRMSDVAERAGVSKATVSRVLNNREFIDPETRRRVLEVARQLKYCQNVHARTLAYGRSDLFGLIISEIANPFFPDVMRGFEEAALKRGFEVLLQHRIRTPTHRCGRAKDDRQQSQGSRRDDVGGRPGAHQRIGFA